jgi:hypothetical protein
LGETVFGPAIESGAAVLIAADVPEIAAGVDAAIAVDVPEAGTDVDARIAVDGLEVAAGAGVASRADVSVVVEVAGGRGAGAALARPMVSGVTAAAPRAERSRAWELREVIPAAIAEAARPMAPGACSKAVARAASRSQQ